MSETKPVRNKSFSRKWFQTHRLDKYKYSFVAFDYSAICEMLYGLMKHNQYKIDFPYCTVIEKYHIMLTELCHTKLGSKRSI